MELPLEPGLFLTLDQKYLSPFLIKASSLNQKYRDGEAKILPISSPVQSRNLEMSTGLDNSLDISRDDDTIRSAVELDDIQ